MVLKFQNPRNPKLGLVHRWCSSITLSAWILGGLSIALLLPSLAADFYSDDYYFYWLTHHQLEPYIQNNKPRVLDYFTFLTDNPERTSALIALGMTPWWIEPTTQLHFFRPLTELTHAIDFALFSSRLPMFLHSLLWYCLLLALSVRIYSRLLKPPSLVLLAFTLFVLSAHASLTLSWIANRNALIATVFLLLALSNYLTFLQSLRKWSLILSLCFWAAALLSAEVAVSGVPVFIAFLFCRYRSLSHSAIGLAALPLIIVIVWLLFYLGYGFGAWSGSGYYVNIFTQPYEFLAVFIQRASEAILLQLTGLPDTLIVNQPNTPIVASALGLSLAIVIYQMKQPALWGLLFLWLVSLIPILSVEVQSRNLLFPTLFIAPLLATIIVHAFTCKHLTFPRLFLLLFATLLLTMHGFFALLLKPVNAYAYKIQSQQQTELIQSLPKLTKPTFVLGNDVFDQTAMIGGRFYHGFNDEYPLINLVTQTQGLIIEPLPNGLRLRSIQGLLSERDLLFRLRFEVGQQFTLFHNTTIQIEAINRQGIPTSIQVTTDTPYHVFIYRGGIFHALRLPATSAR
ncbi:MAG: hypothetical protein OXE99_12300 [Cellvibrionales bacterium]|nr:hypothetical protein [Cellvibrionales bacterium]